MEVTMKAGMKTMLALAAVLVCGAIAAIPAGASGGAPTKSSCSLSHGEQRGDLGADYVYKLSARKLGCDKAKSLVKKFNKCRHEHGGARGKCPGVKGYKCSQKKLDSSPEIYQAKAKCVKGSKKFSEVFGELT
jgi:hypothetical protein